ncbi:MAG: GDSL-type esterase/lipase family protein [Clostridium sp.]|uniref:GDSL-type esterase/lipase family protein n=1 Tax=Clostridium sp. TaxID=1506 RepID=UPI00306842E9
MKNKFFAIGSCIIVVIIIITGVGKIQSKRTSEREAQIISEGRKHLLQLEQADLSIIEEKVEAHHAPVVIVEDDVADIDFKKFFEDTVFMGDSITEGLIDMEIINKYNVIAGKGDTVIKAKEKIGTLAGIRPKNVVLLYGMNDVIEFDNPSQSRGPKEFKDSYISFINEIKIKLPKTNIYIQAPLPVNDKALKINSRLTNENLTEFRAIAKEVSEETGVNYVDIDTLVANNDSLHEGDGIHFKYDFYLKWLTYLQRYMTGK